MNNGSVRKIAQATFEVSSIANIGMKAAVVTYHFFPIKKLEGKRLGQEIEKRPLSLSNASTSLEAVF